MKIRIFVVLIILSIFSSCTKDDGPQINVNTNRQLTGSSANDILAETKFKSIIVELVYVEGFEPTSSTITNFVSFLNARAHKPNGIRVEKRSIPSPGKEVYNIEDIAQIERDEREYYNIGDELAIWAYFSDGKSDQDIDNTLILGTAYWNTSFVIYEETINNLSGGPLKPPTSLLETTVINHEIGHMLGLVDLGTPMQTDHKDQEHENHCDVSNCLMYWASETTSGINNMNAVPPLDSQCLTDLKANGGK